MSHSNKPKTIRLQNIASGNTQLNLHLARYLNMPVQSLRRGVRMTPVRIMPGRYYDVCAELSVNYDEAAAIIARSPEVHAHKRSGRLLCLDYPPVEVPAPVRAQAADAPKEEDAQESGAAPAAADAPQGALAEVTAPAPAAEVESSDEATVSLLQPSMAWTYDDLKSYAETHQIEVSAGMSKTALLRRIRRSQE